jgi:hypothetical protein
VKHYYFSRYSKYALGLFAFIFSLSLILWIGSGGYFRPSGVEAKITKETIVFDKANPQIQVVMAVQHRHTPNLMAIPEVVGTATGLNEAGRPAILIFTKDRAEVGVIPRHLEGIPVVVKVTGEIFVMPRPPWAGGPGGGEGGDEDKVDPTAIFPVPVPIGVSTGNAGECSAGTIGCRVTYGGIVYALSNSHVYASKNGAEANSQILQPGLYDTNCFSSDNNVIGTLSAYVEIDFDGGDNTVDAAIAWSTTDDLGKTTPPDGYGTPKKDYVSAVVGLLVQKYGRTTSLTKGEITGINATVNVGL